jgi:hypothetical protein
MHIGRGRKARFKDKGSVKQAAAELNAMFDPAQSLVGRDTQTASERPPTMQQFLDEVGRQVIRFGDYRPLTVLCGAASFAALRNISSGPSWCGGVRWKLSKFVPPYDVVVMRTAQLAHSGDLH